MFKKHRIYSFLISTPYKDIKQKSIHEICNCTPEYTSKLLKKLQKKGIVEKNNKNTVKLIQPLKLCFILSFEEQQKKPLLYQITNLKDLKQVLSKTIYSITNESAILIKSDEKPKTIFAYVLGKDIDIIDENFQRVRKNPDLIVYPSDHFRFIKQQLINETFLATDFEIIVDLLKSNKTKEAMKYLIENNLLNR